MNALSVFTQKEANWLIFEHMTAEFTVNHVGQQEKAQRLFSRSQLPKRWKYIRQMNEQAVFALAILSFFVTGAGLFVGKKRKRLIFAFPQG
ncbi:MAG TPA: hypothetical protein VMG10_30450 [Gemmataceae bacterium]|nr:hypothetical protein [Gemmataceae bacterium]